MLLLDSMVVLICVCRCLLCRLYGGFFMNMWLWLMLKCLNYGSRNDRWVMVGMF